MDKLGETRGGVGKSGVLEPGTQKRQYLWNA